MENETIIPIQFYNGLGLHSHQTQSEIDYVMGALNVYANALKTVVLRKGDMPITINNDSNGARGFFLKRSLIHQIMDDLQISNDPDDCLFIGFAYSDPVENVTEQHLVFQKAQYIRHRETMQKRIPSPDSPLISLLSTLPHKTSEASHTSPPPGDPYTIEEHE